jgi:hypothetical protein
MIGPADMQTPVEADLGEGFNRRLERALRAADVERRHRAIRRRVGSILTVLILVAPIIAWRLMLSTPDGVHIGIAALAWISFLLDVGVHIDSSILNSLGLQALPSIVGVPLLVLITGWVLSNPRAGDR